MTNIINPKRGQPVWLLVNATPKLRYFVEFSGGEWDPERDSAWLADDKELIHVLGYPYFGEDSLRSTKSDFLVAMIRDLKVEISGMQEKLAALESDLAATLLTEAEAEPERSDPGFLGKISRALFARQ